MLSYKTLESIRENEMDSTFTWLDYSEKDRKRMLDVLDLFDEQTTRDELGIGVVRDAVADLLFPGTSTIQTRARYFLFVPWIYQNLERKRVPSAQIAARVRRDETNLIDPLRASGERGIVGVLAGRSVQRLPSSIYWQGLGTLGIRQFRGSNAQYHAYLDTYYRQQNSPLQADDGGLIENSAEPNWHPGLPQPSNNFPASLTFRLTDEEAAYLRERIIIRAPDSYLAFLVDQSTTTANVDFPWQHPLAANLPGQLTTHLNHAQSFSVTMHGAALLYNLMLAELACADERIDAYREALQTWRIALQANADLLARWNRSQFWATVRRQNSRLSPVTQRFVDSWIDLAFAQPATGGLANNKAARELIRHRELALKRSLSRLTNRRALELWNGAAGTDALSYRWRNVQDILNDIVIGRTVGHEVEVSHA